MTRYTADLGLRFKIMEIQFKIMDLEKSKEFYEYRINDPSMCLPEESKKYLFNCPCCHRVFHGKLPSKPKSEAAAVDRNLIFYDNCIKKCPVLWPWNDEWEQSVMDEYVSGRFCHPMYRYSTNENILQVIKDSIVIWTAKRDDLLKKLT